MVECKNLRLLSKISLQTTEKMKTIEYCKENVSISGTLKPQCFHKPWFLNFLTSSQNMELNISYKYIYHVCYRYGKSDKQ